MGTTLSNTQIRNTYIGLLKTTDNSAVAGALKTVSDGSGNDTGLKVSSNEVNVNSLSIESVPANGALTKMLMWNDSTKDVEYRNYNPSGVNLITADTITSPGDGAQIQLDGGPAICNFIAGSNIEITGSGSSVTINTSLGDAAEQVSMDLTATDVNQGAGDFYQQINFEFRDYENALTKSTLSGSGGITISSSTNNTNGRDFVVDGGTTTWVVSNSSGGGSAPSLAASMDLTEQTASNLIVLVDGSLINQVFSTEATRIITLPPPYVGRRIEIFFTSSTVTGGSFPEPQDFAEPITFQIATASDKDTTVRNSGFAGRALLQDQRATATTPFAIQAFGPSSKKDYLKFQDTSETEINGNGIEVPAADKTVRGLLPATRVVIYGVDNDCYLCDIETFANYGTDIVGCRIMTD